MTCPSAETGCLCQTQGKDCAQGRLCPYRQVEPDPDGMAYAISVLRAAAMACLAIIAFALVVLPEHPDQPAPTVQKR